MHGDRDFTAHVLSQRWWLEALVVLRRSSVARSFLRFLGTWGGFQHQIDTDSGNQNRNTVDFVSHDLSSCPFARGSQVGGKMVPTIVIPCPNVGLAYADIYRNALCAIAP